MCRSPWTFQFRCWQKWAFIINWCFVTIVWCVEDTQALSIVPTNHFTIVLTVTVHLTAEGQMFAEESGCLFRQDFGISRYTIAHTIWIVSSFFPPGICDSVVLWCFTVYCSLHRDIEEYVNVCKDILKFFWWKAFFWALWIVWRWWNKADPHDRHSELFSVVCLGFSWC